MACTICFKCTRIQHFNMISGGYICDKCLEEIGLEVGFEIPHIGKRRIDRDRRMLPFHRNSKKQSQIENRMQEEHVIGFYKPNEIF